MFTTESQSWSVIPWFSRMVVMFAFMTTDVMVSAEVTSESHSTQNRHEMTSHSLKKVKSGRQSDFADDLHEGASDQVSVRYFLDHRQGQSVYINGGRSQGITPGATLHAFRPLPVQPGQRQPATIRTGVLKIIQLGDEFAIAKIIQQSTEESSLNFRHYPKVMSGDLIKIPSYRILSKIHTMPKWKRSYFELFMAPGPLPSTFELSVEGKKLLQEEMAVFQNKQIARLFVRGHTDSRGPSSANQVESLQRALTIKQYLVEELGFDPERVTALGLGESDLLNQSKVYGADRENRRIEITVASGDNGG